MITVEVEKAPPYVALSYTWGSKSLSKAVHVNGCDIRITANLADAIDAIFVFARERNLMFWADSICINQSDVHERSRQVRLMNTIYRSAEIVAIWLGQASHDSDLAFDKMKEWKVKFDDLKQQWNGSEELAALRMICRRPWWKRAWIVQE
ncbi:heterokaryon incompatibility, partial [Trematosphaeria pertusa]